MIHSFSYVSFSRLFFYQLSSTENDENQRTSVRGRSEKNQSLPSMFFLIFMAEIPLELFFETMTIFVSLLFFSVYIYLLIYACIC
jgi:hypothetical protein